MTDQLYRQQIIDNYKSPKNVGKIENPDYYGKKFNTSCGDEIEVFMKIEDNKVVDFKYTVRGCAVSIAAASLLSQEMKGLSLDEIRELSSEFMEEIMGTTFTSSRIKCAMLALDALKDSIKE